MEKLLQISEFAKLANTNRRTLIFYDESDLFHPHTVSEAGYRLYSYDQLYQISFILGLRELGLSINEIKQYLQEPDNAVLSKQLHQLDNKIEQQIRHLKQVQMTIRQRLVHSQAIEQAKFYQPIVTYLPEASFWCSDYAVDCTVEEMANVFSDFYSRLNMSLVTNNLHSGFKTNLRQPVADQYANAGFRIIKEQSIPKLDYDLPTMTKAAGNYIVVKVKNTTPNIEKGLQLIADYLSAHHLKCTGELWQVNLGNKIKTAGFTENGLLEYQLEEQ